MIALDLDRLDFAKRGGTIPVVAQDDRSGLVLMVAYADREALEATLATGEMHFRSASRGLWRKGATSGNVLDVVSLTPDCDGDALLARVRPRGPACHTGSPSCFPGMYGDELNRLDAVVAQRISENADASYTARLARSVNLRAKKLGEETAEFLSAHARDMAGEGVREAADVVYHLLVAVRSMGASWNDVLTELLRRRTRH